MSDSERITVLGEIVATHQSRILALSRMVEFLLAGIVKDSEDPARDFDFIANAAILSISQGQQKTAEEELDPNMEWFRSMVFNTDDFMKDLIDGARKMLEAFSPAPSRPES